MAKTMNLPLKTVAGFTREGGGEFGEEPNVIEAAFSDDVLERRQNSPLVTVGEDRALVLRVTEHKAAEPRPLAEVSAQIREQLKTQRMREAAAAQGAFAMARLQKGEAWAGVASALKLGAVGKRFMTRQDGVAPPAVVRVGVQCAEQRDLRSEAVLRRRHDRRRQLRRLRGDAGSQRGPGEGSGRRENGAPAPGGSAARQRRVRRVRRRSRAHARRSSRTTRCSSRGRAVETRRTVGGLSPARPTRFRRTTSRRC